jgi:hypothetical protein
VAEKTMPFFSDTETRWSAALGPPVPLALARGAGRNAGGDVDDRAPVAHRVARAHRGLRAALGRRQRLLDRRALPARQGLRQRTRELGSQVDSAAAMGGLLSVLPRAGAGVVGVDAPPAVAQEAAMSARVPTSGRRIGRCTVGASMAWSRREVAAKDTRGDPPCTLESTDAPGATLPRLADDARRAPRRRARFRTGVRDRWDFSRSWASRRRAASAGRRAADRFDEPVKAAGSGKGPAVDKDKQAFDTARAAIKLLVDGIANHPQKDQIAAQIASAQGKLKDADDQAAAKAWPAATKLLGEVKTICQAAKKLADDWQKYKRERTSLLAAGMAFSSQDNKNNENWAQDRIDEADVFTAKTPPKFDAALAVLKKAMAELKPLVKGFLVTAQARLKTLDKAKPALKTFAQNEIDQGRQLIAQAQASFDAGEWSACRTTALPRHPLRRNRRSAWSRAAACSMTSAPRPSRRSPRCAAPTR